MTTKTGVIRAVLFDFDGTLTQPGSIDFLKIKQAIGCPPDIPILEFIERLPDPKAREAAFARLDQFEMEAAAASLPNPEAEELIRFLRAQGYLLGIVTRNSRASVQRTLQNFKQVQAADFAVIISRDETERPKPDPQGILLAAERLKLDPSNLLMVGDFIFDIEAGNRAGAITVLLDNHTPNEAFSAQSDYTVSTLGQIKKILNRHRPLNPGKLPNDFLSEVLSRFGPADPALLVGPGIGQDTAAIALNDNDVLIVKSDPITFVSDAVADYAVIINANDIATAGATPRWFLATLLFPAHTTAAQIGRTIQDLEQASASWGITLCGGHTEITDAVTRPVVTGMLAGIVTRDCLIDKRNIQKGDCILLTKGLAVEGSAILAQEFGDRLVKLGMAPEEIAQALKFREHLSILDEARLAADPRKTSAMHDITEGGLATALEELSIAGGHRLRVFMENIPVFPLTERICDLLQLDPLGLIGSGSLLICVRPDSCKEMIRRIHEAGIMVTCIGEVLEKGGGIEALDRGEPVPWPRFETDELARLFTPDGP